VLGDIGLVHRQKMNPKEAAADSRMSLRLPMDRNEHQRWRDTHRKKRTDRDPPGPPFPGRGHHTHRLRDVPHEGAKPFGGIHHGVQEEDEESGASENSAV